MDTFIAANESHFLSTSALPSVLSFLYNSSNFKVTIVLFYIFINGFLNVFPVI